MVWTDSNHSISLTQLYYVQELKRPRTGVSTEGGGVTAASWKWYTLMDEAIGSRPSVVPPVLFASSNLEVAGTPPPPVERDTPPTVSAPKRCQAGTMDGVLDALKVSDRQQELLVKEMERQEERREEARAREAREAGEREERRFHKMMEREERRHQEALERQQRFQLEMRDERRDREAAAREERLMAILERLSRKD